MSKLINIDNFKAIKISDKIAQVCQPLDNISIDYFKQVRIFNDASRISLTNYREWAEYFFDNSLHLHCNCHSFHPARGMKNYVLWDSMTDNTLLAEKKKEFGINHGFSIVEVNSKYTDYFLFATHSTNPAINSFYVNNLDLLNRFIFYFKDKTIKLINDCAPDILSAPLIDETTDIIRNSHPKIDKFITQLEVKKYHIEMGGVAYKIPQAEFNCVLQLLQGLSIKEISANLSISERTCRSYIDNLKTRLNCFSKQELLSKFRQLFLPKMIMAANM